MIINSIIGLDLSISSTGFVKFLVPTLNQSPLSFVIKTSAKCTMMERLQQISEGILACVGATSLVFIEGYSYGSFNTEVLAQLGGIVKLEIYKMTGIAPIIVSPNTLKKFVLGSGKGQAKDAIKLGVYKRWGVEFKTDDETDAYALARLGLQVCGVDKWEHEYERECIKALTVAKKGKVNKKTGKKGEDKPNPNTIELRKALVMDLRTEDKNETIKRSARKPV